MDSAVNAAVSSAMNYLMAPKYKGRKRKSDSDRPAKKRKLYATKPVAMSSRTAALLPEKWKWRDYSDDDGAIATTLDGAEMDPAATSCLNSMVQGDTQSTRNGNQIIVKSIFLNYSIFNDVVSDQADALAEGYVRLLLVLDKQTNGVQMDSEDVWACESGLKTLAMRNLYYTRRYEVLMDRLVHVSRKYAFNDAAATGSIASATVYGQYFKPCSIPVEFDGNAGTVADIVDNSLHLIAVSSGAGYKLTYNCRIRFVG